MNGFLFDENLPVQIRFTPSLPVYSTHSLGRSISDAAVWEYASARSLVIVSKDTDFSNRCLLSEPPPWVVHLRIGNLRRVAFHRFLAIVWPRIEELLPDCKLVNVYIDRIEGIR